MDRTKTGALIAAARKEQNMTQKELAAALHVSDRAVSKWERGAGFPDISLLEPLADALGLGVLDLLRGERGTVPEPEPTIRQALAFLARQAKERTRRKWSQVLGGTCALLMAGFVLFAILDRAGVFLQEISLEVPATVYSAEGVSAGETTVAIVFWLPMTCCMTSWERMYVVGLKNSCGGWPRIILTLIAACRKIIFSTTISGSRICVYYFRLLFACMTRVSMSHGLYVC